jgi:hypothetical protein
MKTITEVDENLHVINGQDIEQVKDISGEDAVETSVKDTIHTVEILMERPKTEEQGMITV